jgi:hypothetical protein
MDMLFIRIIKGEFSLQTRLTTLFDRPLLIFNSTLHLYPSLPIIPRCLCCIRCGAQFTSKMEGMLNDLSIGADTSRAFSEFVRTHGEAKASLGKMEFSVQVSSTHNSLSHL